MVQRVHPGHTGHTRRPVPSSHPGHTGHTLGTPWVHPGHPGHGTAHTCSSRRHQQRALPEANPYPG